MTFSGF